MDEKPNGKTFEVELSSFAVIPYLCLLLWDFSTYKFCSCAGESYYCGNSTIVCPFNFSPQYLGSGTWSMHFIFLRSSEESCIFYNSCKESQIYSSLSYLLV